MDRVVSTAQIAGHEVSVVEVQDDEDAGYRLVVDGVARDGLHATPPDPEEVTRMVLRPH